jgi:hypothetical protein
MGWKDTREPWVPQGIKARQEARVKRVTTDLLDQRALVDMLDVTVNLV